MKRADQLVLAALAVLVVAVAAPYLAAYRLPFNDLPGHLGGASVFIHFDDPSYRLAEHYEKTFQIVPYMLFYGFAWLAAHAGLLSWAPNLFIVLFDAIGLSLAVLALVYAFKRDRALVLLAPALTLNHVVFYGFLDSSGATTLALLALALQEVQSREAPRLWRDAVLAALGAAVALGHLMAFFALCALAPTLAACHTVRPAALARRLAWLVPGLLLLGVGLANLTKTLQGGQEHLRWGFPPFRGVHLGLVERITAPYQWLFSNYHDAWQEHAHAGVWLATLAGAAVIALWLRRRAAPAAAPDGAAVVVVSADAPTVAAPPRGGLTGAAPRWAIPAAALALVIVAFVIPGAKGPLLKVRLGLVGLAAVGLALWTLHFPRVGVLARRHRIAVLFGVVLLLFNLLPLSLPQWFGVNIRLVIPMGVLALLLVPAGTFAGRRAWLVAPAALATLLFSLWVAADLHRWNTTYMDGFETAIAGVARGSRYVVLHEIRGEHYRTRANLFDCGYVMAEKGGVCTQVLILGGGSWVKLKAGRYPAPASGRTAEWRCDKFAALYDYVLVSGPIAKNPFDCLGDRGPPAVAAGNWRLYVAPGVTH